MGIKCVKCSLQLHFNICLVSIYILKISQSPVLGCSRQISFRKSFAKTELIIQASCSVEIISDRSRQLESTYEKRKRYEEWISRACRLLHFALGVCRWKCLCCKCHNSVLDKLLQLAPIKPCYLRSLCL
jgi:hypothetical protein